MNQFNESDQITYIKKNGSNQFFYIKKNGSKITLLNDVASATVISLTMFSANDLASAMIISLFNFIAADLFLSIDAFFSYDSNHSHSYASGRFFFSYTAHQTLIESEKYSVFFLVVNWLEKNKINSIKSTFDQLRHMFRLFTDFYIRRSSNAFRISFFFSFFQNFNQ